MYMYVYNVFGLVVNMTSWDLSYVNKRAVLKLSIDYKHPIWPTDAVIESGLWTFPVSDITKSQINVEIDIE